MIVAIIVGLVAGFLASKIMHGSGDGFFMDLVWGLVGAVVGRFVLGFVGIGARGLIGAILVATFGAVLVMWLVRSFKSRGAY